ncbi:MAG: class I SAM-dependent methyltransferase [Acidimicrobiales bacterium]
MNDRSNRRQPQAPGDAELEAVDPRREHWRSGSYEIVGDWLAPASLSVLDLAEQAGGRSLDGRRLLDVATGTGTVAIEAGRRGADVLGVDITPELLEVARKRADEAGVDVRFGVADFDELDVLGGGEVFDVVTSSFGVMFAPHPASTLSGLGRRLDAGGVIAVAAWDPDGVFMVPESMLELLPERPEMSDMTLWTTRIPELASSAGCEVVATRTDDLLIGFESPGDAAVQLERWSVGWPQLLTMFDGLGVGAEARRRFEAHLADFSRPTDDGVALVVGFFTAVIRPAGVRRPGVGG